MEVNKNGERMPEIKYAEKLKIKNNRDKNKKNKLREAL